MTPNELIEAAAMAMAASHGITWENLFGTIHDHPLVADYNRQAEAALRSLPIPLDKLALLASGEAWIAPMTDTDEMMEAGMLQDSGHPSDIYRAMRDRYLTPDETKP